MIINMLGKNNFEYYLKKVYFFKNNVTYYANVIKILPAFHSND